MARVALRLVEDGTAVEVELDGVTTAARSELEYALMLSGGTISGRGFRLPAFAFRRSSTELAGLVRRAASEVEIDDGVDLILRTHLEEIRARRSAEEGLVPLTAEEIESVVRATGRLTRQLTGEQEVNLGRLLALPHGANFSVPGAGKTTTLLAIYEAMRGSGRVDRLLVVAPKNAFLSWEQEVVECFPIETRPMVERLTGGRSGVAATLLRDPEITLITYQLLPNVIDVVKLWARRHRAHVVLDESHRAKSGYSGVYASAALQLAEVAIRRDILSGTPLPHAPEDLRPQLDFLWPGQRVLQDFRLLSESPPEVIEDVERRLRPLYVRTTKDQLQLPPLELRAIGVDLGPLQRELYELLRSEAARVAAGMGHRDRRYFRALGRQVVRLIQAASNPILLTQAALVDRPTSGGLVLQGTRAWELLRELARSEQPAKVERAVSLTEAAIRDGDRVLIWSGFVLNILALERLLAAHNPVILFGQVPTGIAEDPDTREGRIRRFHEDASCRVMIANPAAAGEGISLHRACQYAIYLDRNFNAAHYLQSIDRIHRLGSERPSRVDVLEARGTIDSRINERLRIKIEAMALILNDDGLRALVYDPEDVIEEFEGGLELDDIEEVVEHLVGGEGDD